MYFYGISNCFSSLYLHFFKLMMVLSWEKLKKCGFFEMIAEKVGFIWGKEDINSGMLDCLRLLILIRCFKGTFCLGGEDFHFINQPASERNENQCICASKNSSSN